MVWAPPPADRRPAAKPHRVATLLLRPERAGDDAVRERAGDDAMRAVRRGACEAVEDDAGADDEVERKRRAATCALHYHTVTASKQHSDVKYDDLGMVKERNG